MRSLLLLYQSRFQCLHPPLFELPLLHYQVAFVPALLPALLLASAVAVLATERSRFEPARMQNCLKGFVQLARLLPENHPFSLCLLLLLE